MEDCKSYLPVFPIICHCFPVNATGMANMLICRHFANLVDEAPSAGPGQSLSSCGSRGGSIEPSFETNLIHFHEEF